VYYCHDEHWGNKSEKQVVIQLSNTIVNVLAMMVEVIHASIAFSTMFCWIQNISTAKLAAKFIIIAMELVTKLFRQLSYPCDSLNLCMYTVGSVGSLLVANTAYTHTTTTTHE
jgi:hypothetical protein